MYKLIDYNAESITGNFYAQELQIVDMDKDNPYKIEKILKTKKVKGKKFFLVKYLHWPTIFNSWTSEADMITL